MNSKLIQSITMIYMQPTVYQSDFHLTAFNFLSFSNYFVVENNMFLIEK